MNRVLITGARGFVGRQCLPLLAKEGYEVHAVTSQMPENSSGITWHKANLLDRKQTSLLFKTVQPTHLLHLAWYTVPGKYWTALENLSWVEAGLQMLDAFAQEGGKRFVTAGSCAEYEWEDALCSEETTPLRPATFYGACKHGLQIISEAFARQRGLSQAWGRLFFLYGPHEQKARLVSSVICSLLEGRAAECTAATQIRDFLYVQDVADAFVTLLGSTLQGPVNIAAGKGVALKDILTKIGEKIGKPELIHWGVLPMHQGEPPVLLADTKRLEQELGWQPKFDLDRGLDETIDWWRNKIGEVDDRHRTTKAHL